MRLVLMIVMLLSVGAQQAFAQNVVRYFTNVTGLMDDLDTDVILKETRAGPKVISAELDVCHAAAANVPQRERFVVTLKPQGNRLIGSGQSQDSKTPVSVDLVRGGSTGNITFEGTIKYGDRVFKASSSDNADMSAKEFEEQTATEETIVENPSEFRDVTPGTLALRVQRTALNDVLKALRPEKVRVQAFSIMPSCDALRRGTVDLQLDVDPERAQALVAKTRSLNGVTRAGWTSGGIDLTRSVRMPASAWRDSGGNLEREKLGKAISEAAAKTLNARTESAEWDEVTGELSIVVKRPDTTLPGLGLVELIEIPVVVSAERPGGKDSLVIRIGQLSSELEDEGDGPRLTMSGTPSGGDNAEPLGAENLQFELAKTLKGEIWDTEAEAWAKP